MLRRQKTQLTETVYFCYSFISALPPLVSHNNKKIKTALKRNRHAANTPNNVLLRYPPCRNDKFLLETTAPIIGGGKSLKAEEGEACWQQSPHINIHTTLSQHTTMERAASTRVKASQSTASL